MHKFNFYFWWRNLLHFARSAVFNIVFFFLCRIKDLEELQYLLPDVAKDDAFGKYYSKIEGKCRLQCRLDALVYFCRTISVYPY